MSNGSDLRLKINTSDELPEDQRGWVSGFVSVQRCSIIMPARKSKHTRKNVSEALDQFFIHALHIVLGPEDATPVLYNPDEYVKRKKAEIEAAVQRFCDSKRRANCSIKYANVIMDYLLTFFAVNGFKNGRALDVERYHMPARYRKKPQYVPNVKEAWSIVANAGALKYRASIACIITGGLNSRCNDQGR